MCVLIGKVYTLEGVLVVSSRQGFRPAQATLKQTLLKYAKEKGFAANFTDFKVRKSELAITSESEHIFNFFPGWNGPARLCEEADALWLLCRVPLWHIWPCTTQVSH